MNRYITKLIAGGESQILDFKFCISDSKKIARTLSAFANTDGGRLLIGVRDNGSVAGVRSDEEYYMIETAAGIFCNPEVPVTIKQHHIKGKTILEVVVERGDKRPYKAKGEDGKWKAYFRHGDQNLAANRLIISYWKKSERKTGVLIRFGKPETDLMKYLKEKGSITLSGFRKLSGVPSYKAERIIVNLLACNILIIDASEKGISYSLYPDPEKLRELSENSSLSS